MWKSLEGGREWRGLSPSGVGPKKALYTRALCARTPIKKLFAQKGTKT